ncbi:hypothetical protein L195_g029396, partial [Trifolium pratense]
YPFPQYKGWNRQAFTTIINTLPLAETLSFRIDRLSETHL